MVAATATATSSSLRHPQYYDSAEEEEERRLSALHGEAADDDEDAPPPATRKRKEADDGDGARARAAADAAASAAFDEKVRRKRTRPVLTAAALKGEKGLVVVRRSFPATVVKFRDAPAATKKGGRVAAGVPPEKRAQRLAETAQINAAARYSRGLVAAYRDFATVLFPTLAPEDVFLKMEELGAKKEVKDYLNIMREDMRKEHVEGLLGKEKAGRILDELQYGMRAANLHPDMERLKEESLSRYRVGQVGGAQNSGRDDESEEGGTEAPQASRSKRVVVTNPYAKKLHEANVGSAAGGEKMGADTTADDGATQENGHPVAEEDEEEEAAFSVDGVDEANNAVMPTAAEDGADTADKEQAAKAEKQNGFDKEMNGGAEESADTEELQDDADTINGSTELCKDEAGAKDNTDQVDTVDHAAEENVLKTQETDINAEEQGKVSPTLPVGGASKHGAESALASLSQEQLSVETPTQETLTLAASQLDAMDTDFTQASAAREDATQTATQSAREGESERFSQTQDDGRFSQMPDSERFSPTQDDERFSQTQDGGASRPPIIFEEVEDNTSATRHSTENDGEESEGSSSGQQQLLGQTMDTQLSMEY